MIDYKVVEVDVDKAKHNGIPWKTLGDFGKRKFENMLILKRASERLKIRYVQTTKQ
jgi:hypothetical protein